MEEFAASVVQLGQGFYAIDQQMVRSFLIVGTKSALCLDAGVSKADFTGLIRSVTDLPVSCCLTHTDGDHTANLDSFSRIYIHSDELPLLKQEQCAAGAEIIPVVEETCFDLGGIVLKVVSCPGHTPGSIALLDEKAGILFSGDTVSYGPVYLFGGHRDPEKYMKSLLKLRTMAERGIFNTVYPSHNTCPVSADIISDLIECAMGIKDGSLKGRPAEMGRPGMEDVMLYTYGKCGIYR